MRLIDCARQDPRSTGAKTGGCIDVNVCVSFGEALGARASAVSAPGRASFVLDFCVLGPQKNQFRLGAAQPWWAARLAAPLRGAAAQRAAHTPKPGEPESEKVLIFSELYT